MIERDEKITFGTLSEDGQLSNVRFLTQAQIAACPHVIFVPEHYREDGTCKCDDPIEQERMIREWGYTKDMFAEINEQRVERMREQARDGYDDGEING